jgi:hypothetical protein
MLNRDSIAPSKLTSMSIAPAPAPEKPTNAAEEKGLLKVSSYEQAATLVITLLVIFGTSFGALGMIFFANKFNREDVVEIEFVPMEASSPTANGGFGTDPEPPGVEDGSELAEPNLEDTLAAVEMTTELLSDSVISDAVVTEQSLQGTSDQASKGSGVGDGRRPGPGGDGVIERVPRWERWKIRFEPSSTTDFAKWLDQFKIRIGVLGRDNKVHVAFDFTSGAPKTESAAPLDYNGWGQTLPADGPMPALTKDLARKAGTLQRGPIALLFYPLEVEQLLYTLEKNYMLKSAHNKHDPNKIRETVFTVLQDRNGYRFEVIDQKYF